MPVLVFAAHPTPTEVIRTSIEGLRQAVRHDAVEIDRDPDRVLPLIREHIVPNIDTDLFSKLILGPHWLTASESQRAAFSTVFVDALLHIYGVLAAQYTEAEVRYVEAVPVGARLAAVRVRTEVISAERPPIRVDYRMVLRNGNWKAVDASIDGISIVRTYRAAVNEEILRVGMDAVIERMGRKRL